MLHRCPRGFSLLELLVVIAIFSLVLAVGVPGISTWLNNLSVRTAASAVHDGLQQARGEAIRRNENVSFWLVSATDPTAMDSSCALSSTSSAWVISLSSPVNACNVDPSTTTAPRIVATRVAGDGGNSVTVAALNAAGTAANQVSFDGFGRVVNAGAIARINFSKDSSTRNLRVVVSNTGAIRMCDPTVTSSTDPRYC